MKYAVRRRLAAQQSLERIVVSSAEHDLEAQGPQMLRQSDAAGRGEAVHPVSGSH